MAARGLSFKRKLSNPTYFSQVEKRLSFGDVKSMVESGMTMSEMAAKTGRDPKDEELRQKGILAVETKDADGTLGRINSMGVDQVVRLSQESPSFKSKAQKVLDCPQKRSLLPPEKASVLAERLK